MIMTFDLSRKKNTNFCQQNNFTIILEENDGATIVKSSNSKFETRCWNIANVQSNPSFSVRKEIKCISNY